MITWTPHAAPLLVAILLIAGGTGVWWLFRVLRRRWPRRVALALTAPKAAVLALLILALLDPGVRDESSSSARRTLVLFSDQSDSMELADAPGGSRRARADRIAGELAADLPARVRVERRWFDTAIHDRPAIAGGNGRGTDMGACLQELARQLTGTDCLGVVVLSDGGDEPVEAAGLPACPIATVGMGGDVANLDDVGLAAAVCPEAVERGVDFEIAVDVAARGSRVFLDRLGAVPLVVERADAGGRWQPIDKASVDLRQGRARTTFRRKEADPGTVRLRLSLEVQRGEATILNNRRELGIDVRERSLHVLYFSRVVGVEFKLLRAELARDPGVTFTALYRTLGERFMVQGDRISGDDDLTAGFPKDAKALARYDVIVLGSFAADAWSVEEQKRLVAWVAEGGALVALGGDESFGTGGYASSPLAPLLPWQIRADEPRPLRSDVVVSVPPGAASHPVMRGIAEAMVAAGSPVIASLNRPGVPRPGATPLLVAEDQGRQVVVAIQSFAKGKVLGIATDTLWRLARAGHAGANAYGLFWRQAVRTLADKAEGGAALRVSWDKARYRPGETATATVRLTAGGNARLDAWYAPDKGARRDLLPQVASGEQAVSTVTVPFANRGTYAVHLTANQDGTVVESYDKTFLIAPSLPEGARLERDDDGLKRLAESHGGIHVPETGIAPMKEWLAAQARAGTLVTTRSLVFGAPWWFIALMAALVAEWVVRRRRNLI